jgi:hypothetical protein
MECDDAIIRDGVRAFLAQRDDDAEAAAMRRASLGWTTFQIADVLVLERMRRNRQLWADYREPRRRDTALERFHAYAYQWY